MTATIRIKNSTTKQAVPKTLKVGELAINAADGKIFYADANKVVQEFKQQSTLIAGTLPNHIPTNSMLGAMAYADSAVELMVYNYAPSVDNNTIWAQDMGVDDSSETTSGFTLNWMDDTGVAVELLTVSPTQRLLKSNEIRITTTAGHSFLMSQYHLVELLLTLQAIEAGATDVQIVDADGKLIPAAVDEIKEVLAAAFKHKQQVIHKAQLNVRKDADNV